MDYNFLTDFLLTYRPTGFEKSAAKYFASSAVNIKDVRLDFIDKMWNVCASVGSDEPDALKVLISGHSDQNCLIISEITKNGFLKYIPQGGFSPKTVIDSDMFILTNSGKNKVKCFCSYKAVHLEKSEDRKKCPEHKDLYLDCGCSSKEDVESLGISVGDLVVFNNSRLDMEFGKNKNFIVGSGLDDGIACGIVFSVLENIDIKKLKKNNVRLYCACITSEETGCRGAGNAVRKIGPDISIDIDVCHDCTSEIGKTEGSQTHVGDGVVIEYGPEKYRPLNDALKDIAKKNVKYQLVTGKAGGTNTNNIQMMSDNCASALLSIPCRYMHSATHEMVDRNDVEACEKLVRLFIDGLKYDEWK